MSIQWHNTFADEAKLKDFVYNTLNSVTANWRRFLLLLSARVIVQRLLPLTDGTTTNVLIADDTL